MSYETDAQLPFPRSTRRPVPVRAWVFVGPRHRTLAQPPSQEVSEPTLWLAARIEETLSVEVVAGWTIVVKAAGGCTSIRSDARKRDRPEKLQQPSSRQHGTLSDLKSGIPSV
jgi:hypothetical protein